MTERKTGRILRAISGFYDVQTDTGMVTCRGRGTLRRSGSPLTGDMVEISVEHGKGMVEKILPRKNCFVRPAVANIDALVVFAASVNPITEPFLIDRVAAIAGDQEVPVILCVNKCDMDPAADLRRIYTHAGFPVIRASAETGEGVEELRGLLRGKLGFNGLICTDSGSGALGKAIEILAAAAILWPARSQTSWAGDGTPPVMWSCTVWRRIRMWRIRRAFPPSIRIKWKCF